MSFFRRLFGRPLDRDAMRPAYDAVVARARDPWWYRVGGVPDTLDGRFDMVAATLAILLLRLERDGEAAQGQAWLTEIFVDDMDSQLREAGVGDVVVGKHVGKMMGALGGRLTAFRAGLAPGASLDEALVRNLWRGAPPEADRVAQVAARLRGFAEALAARPADQLLAGELPA